MNGWDVAGEVARLAVTAGVGFGSAQLALHVDRKRLDRLADAEWEVTPIPESAAKRGRVRGWVIKNVGTRAARDVAFETSGLTLLRDPGAATTFHPGDGEMLFAEPAGEASMKMHITWLSHRGEARETSRLLELGY